MSAIASAYKTVERVGTTNHFAVKVSAAIANSVCGGSANVKSVSTNSFSCN